MTASTETHTIWNSFRDNVKFSYPSCQMYEGYTTLITSCFALLWSLLQSHVSSLTRKHSRNLLLCGGLRYKESKLKVLSRKLYHIVLFKETKWIVCIFSIKFMSTVLRYTSAVQHCYSPGCTCTSLRKHADFYLNSCCREHVPLQEVQAEQFVKKFSLKFWNRKSSVW